uniref:Phage head-tail adaptor, putative n=1 Tax=Rhodopseudomonas palustris (strain BisA53) TaxID=316055 RepID=Q07QC5_RHOP5
MIDPGLLTTRLTLLAPVESDDGQGGVRRSFAPQQTLWAWVAPLVTRQRDEADAQVAELRVRIVIRAGVALTLQHRLGDGAKIYRIKGWREIEDRRFVAIDAELRLS